jgi:multicomponent Na+:H+ antiporter subunit D
MTDLPVLLVLLPLVGAVVTALAPARRTVAITVAVAQLGLAVTAAVTVLRDGPVDTAPGGWDPPLGIALRLDGLAAGVGMLVGVVVLAVFVHAALTPSAAGSRSYWPLALVTVAGLQAVLVAADLFTVYVALELMTVGAVALVALGGQKALAPALRYLLVAVLGSFAFLVAVALVYAQTGVLTLDIAAADLPQGAALATILALVTVGLGIKTALFPLHAWLPGAHAAAPTAVSPLLSALVVKGAFVVLLRVWAALGGDAGLATVVGVLATAAVVWGGVAALRQTQLKRLVAYSTVAQVGYFFLLIPLATAGFAAGASAAEVEVARLAWQGAVLMLLSHGLAKAAMFLTAGTLSAAAGSGEVDGLRGIAAKAPTTVFTFAVAGVCLAGLPPSLAFVGKWQLLDAALSTGAWWVVVTLLVGGLLTAAATARVVMVAMRPADEQEAAAPAPSAASRVVGAWETWPAITLTIVAVATGVGSAWLAELVTVGSVVAP